MASTSINYVGNGTETQYLINFEYLVKGFVQVYVDDVLKVYEDDYVFDDDQLIRFLVAPEDGAEILIQRDTSTSPIITFVNPSILTAKDLNTASIQPLHKLEEIDAETVPWDGETLSIGGGTIDMGGGTIINLGDPTDPKDAVTKEYVDAADAEINKNLTTLNTTVDSNFTTLNNRIDGIQVAGVTISAEAGNAVTTKPDGLYVADLSQDITDIKADDVAQWVQIRTNETNIATNTKNIATNAENIETNAKNIRANSAAIVAVGNRVTTLEEAQAGGGFNTLEVIETSGTYTAPVDGWYKITIIGGGGSGGSGMPTTYMSSGGGGGASGGVKTIYKNLVSQSTLDVVIGAGGAAATTGGTSGTAGGDTTITSGSESFTAPGGGGGQSRMYAGGDGGVITMEDGFGGQGVNGTPQCYVSSGVIYGGSGGTGGHNGTPFGSGGGGGGGGGSTVGAGGRGGTGNGGNGSDGALVSAGGGGGLAGAGGAGAVILEYYNEDSTTGGSSGGDTGGSSSVVISPQANNALVELLDGLFVNDLSTDVKNNTTGVGANATNITSLIQRVSTLETAGGSGGATVTISAESGNAIVKKTDGLYVADLSGDITTITNRVTTLETSSSGGGNPYFDEIIHEESGTFTAEVTGTYMVTLCGGGGGGGAGSPWQGSAYGSSPGGGGGGSGECEVVTVDMTAGEEYTVVIGAAGIGGVGNTSGNAVEAATDGGATSFTSTTTTIEVDGGMAGGYGQTSKPGIAGRGASGGMLGYRVNTGGNGGNGANGGFGKYGAGGGGGHGGGMTTALSENGYAGYGGWGAGDAYQSQTAGFGGHGGDGSQGVVRLVWSRKE